GFAVVVVVLLAILALSARELRPEERRRRRALLVFRITGLALFLLLAARPTILRGKVEEIKGRLFVLTDSSRSMGVANRDNHVRSFLTKHAGSGAILHKVGAGIERLPSSAPDAYVADVPRSAVLRDLAVLLEDGGADDLGAVLLLSDGADHSGSVNIEALAAHGVRVHSAWISGDDFDDDAVARVEVDPVLFLRQEASVRVVVTGTKDGVVEVGLMGEGRTLARAE